MNKKIALLLAFAMLLSVLPMNVFASTGSLGNGNGTFGNGANTSSLPFLGNSGSLDNRQLGPAQNVRHWGGDNGGVMVGRLETLNAFRNYNGTISAGTAITNSGSKQYTSLTEAPTGNMRNIVISGDYFQGMNDRNTSDPIQFTNVVVDIHNVASWLGRFNGVGSDNMRWTSEQAVAVAITPLNDRQSALDLLNAKSGSAYAESMEAWDTAFAGMTGGLTTGTPIVYSNAGGVNSNGLPITGTPSFGVALRPVNDTQANLFIWRTIEFNDQFLQNPREMYLDLSTVTAVDTNADGTPDSWENLLSSSVRYPMIESGISYDLVGANFEAVTGMGGSHVKVSSGIQNIPWFAVPIEYLTNSDTNDNPVYLTFQERAGWDQLGEANRRTDLTTNTPDGRFSFSVDTTDSNDIRTFHRYGRGELPGIRIAEGAQSAFNGLNQLWVEMELVTPGFYWTEDSINDLRFQTRYVTANSLMALNNANVQIPGNNIATGTQRSIGSSPSGTSGWWVTTNGNTNIWNSLRTIPRVTEPNVTSTDNVRRTPETGTNRNRILSFAVDLPGVGVSNRQVNDWIDVHGLSVGADDRARTGDVQVEVRLYNAVGASDSGSSSGTQQTSYWELMNNLADVAGYTNVIRQLHPPGAYNAVNTVYLYSAIPVGGTAPVYWTATTSMINSNDDATRTRASYSANDTSFNFGTTSGQVNIPVGGISPEVDTSGNDISFERFTTDQEINTNTSGGELWKRAADIISGARGTVTVARFGEIGLELLIHPNDNVDDHQLRSGMRAWDFNPVADAGESRPIGAVVPNSVNNEFHQTARVILRELSPGSLPATGAQPTSFNFNEGIQILGARIWANEAHFSAGEDDDDDTIWFGNTTSEADHFFRTSINRNSVSIRPEIGWDTDAEGFRRWRIAEITAEFYISVQAGYEHLYGEDIEVTVTSGTVDEPFEDSITVAYAWDPITVSTQNVVLDENDIEAAFGLVRGINISDVVISETRSGELVPGQRIWLGIEGAVSRGWGSADHAALRAGTVTTRGDTRFEVSPVQHDSHGSFVEIMRGSQGDGAEIVFSDIQISGRVVPDHQYNLMVADNAIAHNWEGWGWLANQNVGFTTGTIRGFFNPEPYVTPAFRFEGNEFYAPVDPPSSGSTGGDNTVRPPIVNFPPTTLGEWMSSYTSIRTGLPINGAPIVLVPNIEDPSFQTSYVMFAVVADLIGIEGDWNEQTRTGTFSNGSTTVVLENGQRTAMVNGQPVEIRTAQSAARPNGLMADSRIINDRFYVPISFFSTVQGFQVSLTWNDGAPGSRSITVFPNP